MALVFKQDTEILTEDDQEKLWSSGVMGLTTPRSLRNASFFIVGKMFSLRGGVEHRKLKLSQRGTMIQIIMSTMRMCLKPSGSFWKLCIKGKVVLIYACP